MIRSLPHTIDSFPAIAGFAFVCLGILTSLQFLTDALFWTLPAWVASLAVMPVAWRKGSRSLQWAAVATILFFTGLNTTLMSNKEYEQFIPPRSKAIIHCTVKDKIASGPGFRILLVAAGTDMTHKCEIPGSGRVFLRGNSSELCPGDRIGFQTFLRKPYNRKNPGEFNWENYCRNQGILWLASIRGPNSILVIRRGWRYHPAALLFRLKESINRFLEGRWTGDVRAIAKGVVLGDRGELTPALRTKFADSGLAHVLSASGLHVGIVSMLAIPLVSILSRLFPSLLLHIPFRKVAAGFSIPLMLIYCLLVGARVPSVRATIMGLVVAVALLANRRWHSLNSLGLAGLIIVLISPLSLFSVGFQLSFLAVLGILIAVPQLMDTMRRNVPQTTDTVFSPERADVFSRLKLRFARWYSAIACLLFTPMAAQAAVSPLVLDTFHSLPTYSLAANLATCLMLTLALPLALIGSLAAVVSPTVGSWVSAPAGILFQFIIDMADIYSSLPGSTFFRQTMGTGESVAIGIAAGCFLMFLRGPSIRRLMAAGLTAAMLPVVLFAGQWVRAENAVLKATFLNVGKADAAFIQPPGTPGILVDGGVRTLHFDSGTNILIPFLKYSGVRSLDSMVITHPQMDHMGGLLSVVPLFPPERVWLNRIPLTVGFQDRILAQAKIRGARIEQADRKLGLIECGKARLRFLNPTGLSERSTGISSDLNNSSVVFRLDYGRVSFLFTGDLEHEGERELVQSGLPLEATVLKVGHHGCGTSSSMAFLQAVRPRVAVISCSDTNAGGCPTDDVLARLKAVGARILWTGREGAVVIETDGKKLRLKAGTGEWHRISLSSQAGG